MESDTVKAWIDRAREIDNTEHLVMFWRALDIIEGYTWARKGPEVAEYIEANVRQSPARDKVLARLRG